MDSKNTNVEIKFQHSISKTAQTNAKKVNFLNHLKTNNL